MTDTARSYTYKHVSVPAEAGLTIAVLATLALGIFPTPILSLAQRAGLANIPAPHLLAPVTREDAASAWCDEHKDECNTHVDSASH